MSVATLNHPAISNSNATGASAAQCAPATRPEPGHESNARFFIRRFHHRFGGVTSRISAPCSSLMTSSDNRSTRSRSLVLSEA